MNLHFFLNIYFSTLLDKLLMLWYSNWNKTHRYEEKLTLSFLILCWMVCMSVLSLSPRSRLSSASDWPNQALMVCRSEISCCHCCRFCFCRCFSLRDWAWISSQRSITPGGEQSDQFNAALNVVTGGGHLSVASEDNVCVFVCNWPALWASVVVGLVSPGMSSSSSVSSPSALFTASMLPRHSPIRRIWRVLRVTCI